MFYKANSIFIFEFNNIIKSHKVNKIILILKYLLKTLEKFYYSQKRFFSIFMILMIIVVILYQFLLTNLHLKLKIYN